MTINFNYISSILLGISLKMFDDFSDLNITKDPVIFDILKIVMIMTTYFLIDECYILSIIIFTCLIVSNYCKRFDIPFWDAYTYFVGFLGLAYYYKFGSLIEQVMSFKILFVLFIPLSIYLEEKTFTEEKTENKTLMRSISIVINSFIILYLTYFDFIKDDGLEYFIYLLLFCNFYFLTNIIIQNVYAKHYEKIDDNKEVINNNDNNNFSDEDLIFIWIRDKIDVAISIIKQSFI